MWVMIVLVPRQVVFWLCCHFRLAYAPIKSLEHH